jgi:hypothetical protein
MDDKDKKNEVKCEECGGTHTHTEHKMPTDDEIRTAKGHLLEHARTFDALALAAISGRLVMGICKDTKTGEKFCTLCAVIEESEKDGVARGVQVVPLARMIDGNPFEVCVPPDAGVLVMPATQSLTERFKNMVPSQEPSPMKGGMLN